jgi:hypothetical protein
MRKNVRTLRVVIAVFAMLCFASAAAAFSHSHSDGAGQACQVCHAAHLPALQVVPAAQVNPPLLGGFHVSAEDVFLHAAPIVLADSPRAPPSMP